MMAAAVVLVDDPAGRGTAAARWAAREAAERGTHLHILMPDGPRCPDRRRGFARVLTTVRGVAPDLAVTVEPVAGSLADRLAVDAGREGLIVSSPGPEIASLVLAGDLHWVVVPDAAVSHGPVLVGIGPGTGPEVMAFALDEAARLRSDLRVVRTWTDPQVDLGLLLPAMIERWDAADSTVRRDLADQLTAFALSCPQVRTDCMVVNDSCTDMLTALATRARLLVLGRPTDHEPATSPALRLAALAPCPVAIVGPTRGAPTAAEADRPGPSSHRSEVMA